MLGGQRQRAFRDVDEVEQELLPGRVRLIQDMEVVIEIVEALRLQLCGKQG